jgi:hypothetical protein
MNAIKAHYDGKVIVLDEPVRLRKGQKLVLRIETLTPSGTTKASSRPRNSRNGAAQRKKLSILEWAKRNAVKDDDLPTDLAHQHDHYLYGTPKKPPTRS